MKIACPPGVVEHSHPDVTLAHDRRDLRQRYIEPSRLGKLRREQAKLHLAGHTRLGIEMNA